MPGFVILHLRHDGPGRMVGRGQALQMALQMCFDLPLGFHHKTQAHAVATQPARQQADAKSPCVPQGIEQRGACAKRFEALFGPGQVIGFFGRCCGKMRAQRRVRRGKGLGAVKGLRADLTHMVHPHQRARQLRLGSVQRGGLVGQSGAGPCCPGRRKQGAQRGVGSVQKGIGRGHVVGAIVESVSAAG